MARRNLDDPQKKTYTSKVLGVPNREEHTVELAVSTNRRDRHGEVILHEAWEDGLENFMRQNGPLLSQHNYWGSLKVHMGETKTIRVDKKDGLIPNLKYYIGGDAPKNEEVEWAWFLVCRGSAAFSVGFQPIEWVEGNGVDEPFATFTKVDLIENSQVLIGANPDAVQNALQRGIISKEYSKYILQNNETSSIVVPEGYENLKKDIDLIHSSMGEIKDSIADLTEKFSTLTGRENLREENGSTTLPGPFA